MGITATTWIGSGMTGPRMMTPGLRFAGSIYPKKSIWPQMNANKRK
jgi:hypothetical protein